VLKKGGITQQAADELLATWHAEAPFAMGTG
jgi:hypothetical protein